MFKPRFRFRPFVAGPFVLLLIALALFQRGGKAVEADSSLGGIAVGVQPVALAINPVTNKIYVANGSSKTVTVIDGLNATTKSVPVGTGPTSVAVNPSTNKIYVANSSSNNVTVIDGTDNSTVTIATGSQPNSIAINSVTNTIYVANSGSGDVSAINGATNTSVTIPAGPNPTAIAVNPFTNRIYVANDVGTVTVIDGGNNVIATVGVGSQPRAIAVNPVTNKTYVVNQSSDNVTVIDGSNTAVASIPVGSYPASIGVNPVTNKIYIANLSLNLSGTVTVIDGSNNSTATVAAGLQPTATAVNANSNKIYVANANSNNVTVIDGANNTTTTTPTGSGPIAMSVNPVTNKAYIVNSGSNSVSLIDGASNAAVTIQTDGNPSGIAFNQASNKVYVTKETASSVLVIDGVTNSTVTIPIASPGTAVEANLMTNKIYVVNRNAATTTIIDGSNNTAKIVTTGNSPIALAINPVTNKIYVANNSGNSVTVIDGVTDQATTFLTGASPSAIAVNPVTNKIYLANAATGTVSVIEGATNTVGAFFAGDHPSALAINSVTNKIYVANPQVGTLTVINGENNTSETIPAGTDPEAVAVNPQTNRIYVANKSANSVTIIDGATNALKTVPVGSAPETIAINSANNKVYVTNSSSSSLTVIDGANDAPTTVATGSHPARTAVNPITGKVYVANRDSSTVTALTSSTTNAIPLNTTVIPFFGNTTDTGNPTFTLTATSSSSPTALPPRNIYYQMDSAEGSWTRANNVFNTPTTLTSGAAATVLRGMHTMYFFATDGADASSINPAVMYGPEDGSTDAIGRPAGPESSLFIGGINSYTFLANVPCSLSANPNTQTFTAAGGTSSTSISSNGCSWTATSNDSWISITGPNAGFGNGGLNYTVGVNNGPARSGTITVGDQTLTINQASGCTYSISVSSANVAASGGNGSTNVVTVAGCTWTAVSNDPWITVTSGALGAGNGAVTFSAAANTLNVRSGTITIASNTFTVNQASGCAFSLSVSGATYTKAGGTGGFSINGSGVCGWTAVSDDSWITITSPASGSGSGNLTYSVAPNDGPPRTGTITAGGKTFTVNQASGCSFVVAPLTTSVAAAGGSGLFTVTSAPGCTWTAVSRDPWVVLTDPGSGSGSGIVTFIVLANVGPARVGTISVAGQNVTINQGSGCTYSISPTSTNVPATGGTGNTKVFTAAGCIWTAVSNDPWITITDGASGSETGNIFFSVHPTTGPARTGTIAIGDQNFLVNQASGCAFNLSSPGSLFGKAGGSGEFTVNGIAGCSWTAVSNAPWITIVGANTGSGTGIVSITVAPNDGPERVGTLTAGGQTFTVTQGSGCSFSFAPTDTTFSTDGGVGGFNVTTNSVCTWAATSNVPWIKIDAGAGTGNGAVTFTVQPNTDAPRIGQVSVGITVFTVNQLGPLVATVSGRVFDRNGLGVKGATVRLVDSNGEDSVATTNSFGFYSFENVPTGATYTVSASVKRFRFATNTITVFGNTTDVDFIGQE